jgi:catechol 2,3-dioxygenase-like lactoylglutathione lyase family enzyme
MVPLSDADLVAFVPTTDLERARAFYSGTLGLRVLAQTPVAVVLDANGTTLRVTLVDAPAQAPYTVLGWLVTSIGETLARLTAAEVEPVRYDGMVQDARGVWVTPSGDLVAWFRDPDGNLLSLTELSR